MMNINFERHQFSEGKLNRDDTLAQFNVARGAGVKCEFSDADTELVLDH